VDGDWLLEHSDPEWLESSGHRIEEAHLPNHQTERQALAEVIGQDGSTLLTDIFAPSTPPLLSTIPAVEILRRIWVQNYSWMDGQIRWRSNDDIPSATTFINSPYDQEARYGKKRETRWTGYKIHLTETCEENLPHLITHVVTTSASVTDEAMTETIHQDLQQNDLSPSQHFVDSGYVTAPILVSSRASGIEVIGPRRPDVRWQANTENGIDVSQFHIDWENECATCPQGYTSNSWTPTLDSRGNESIKIRFSSTDCRTCPLLTSCTSSQSSTPRRLISVRPREQHEALQAARRREQTPAFAKQYAQREGIEATISTSAFAPLTCAVRATLALTKPIYNMSALLLPLILFALWLGWMGTFLLQHASLPSRGSTLPLREFTSSVKIGHEPIFAKHYGPPWAVWSRGCDRRSSVTVEEVRRSCGPTSERKMRQAATSE
jgi:transposase